MALRRNGWRKRPVLLNAAQLSAGAGCARSQLQLPAGRTGALVTNVEPGGAAARAGIRAGDVLLEVNRAAVTGAAEAVDALRNVREETAFALIWRRGQEQFVVMTRQ